jgi:digeranylgeranylglycerophospholipid reductase
MNNYDIVVVGAGPAGCLAGKTAAEKGAAVLIVEEHLQIGLPNHCSGGFRILSGPNKEDLDAILGEIDPRVVLTREKRRRIWSPSGKLYEYTREEGSGYRLDRSSFDFELAKLAVRAGARIMLQTTVIDLIREDGFVRGVITNSKTLPKIHAKVVIAADGCLSQLKGIPKWEGMAYTDIRVVPTILCDVSGVKDVEPGIDEFQLDPLAKRGWHHIVPLDKYSGNADFASMREFEQLKAGKWVLSRKLRECSILKMRGASHVFPMGRMLPKKIKNGLILSGDACGLMGNSNALISGKLAGQAAATAIEMGDVSEEGLGIYDELMKTRGVGKARVWHDERFLNKSEEELEDLWEQINRGIISVVD